MIFNRDLSETEQCEFLYNYIQTIEGWVNYDAGRKKRAETHEMYKWVAEEPPTTSMANKVLFHLLQCKRQLNDMVDLYSMMDRGKKIFLAKYRVE